MPSIKIAEHHVPRNAVCLVALFIGVLAGIVNSFLEIDYTFGPALFGWLIGAIITVVVIHESVHGAVAAAFGHKPIFGLKLPLVYVTFTTKIPRAQFILIALSPLVLLDLLFGALYAMGILKLFANLCFIINSLGAAGDIWITIKLIPYPKDVLVQDTKTGVEVWQL